MYPNIIKIPSYYYYDQYINQKYVYFYKEGICNGYPLYIGTEYKNAVDLGVLYFYMNNHGQYISNHTIDLDTKIGYHGTKNILEKMTITVLFETFMVIDKISDTQFKFDEIIYTKESDKKYVSDSCYYFIFEGISWILKNKNNSICEGYLPFSLGSHFRKLITKEIKPIFLTEVEQIGELIVSKQEFDVYYKNNNPNIKEFKNAMFHKLEHLYDLYLDKIEDISELTEDEINIILQSDKVSRNNKRRFDNYYPSIKSAST